MQLYLNQRLVTRYSRIGRFLVGFGMAIMGAGLVLSFVRPQEVNLVLLTAFVGIIASQGGVAFVNRWARHPRVDEVLTQALKGLDRRHAIFHYLLGVDHALITPSAAYVLVPRLDEGKIEYRDGKWWQIREKKGLFKRGGRRALGDPEPEAMKQAKHLQNAIQRALPEDDAVQVQPVLVFVHPEARISVSGSAVPAVHVKKLKGWLRQQPKGKGPDLAALDAWARQKLGLES